MEFKKVILGIMTVMLSIGVLSGCGSSANDNEAESDKESKEHEENRKVF